MILIITNKTDVTADYVLLEIQKQDIDYLRFNTEDFLSSGNLCWEIDSREGFKGTLKFFKKKANLKAITSVWYRRPVAPIVSSKIKNKQAQILCLAETQAALDGIYKNLDCFWVSRPEKIRTAELKPYQLKIAREVGFKIPKTIITNDPKKTLSFFYECNQKIICKPIKQGRIDYGDKLSLIYTNPVNKKDLKEIERVEYSTTLFQEYIPKKIEVRVTVIGEKVFAAEIHSQKYKETKNDWRRGIDKRPFYFHSLPKNTERKCFKLVNNLGLSFGAIDLILTPSGEYVFLEINPNGQWAWIQECTSLPLREALVQLLVNQSN